MPDSIFCTFDRRALGNWVSFSCVREASMAFIMCRTQRLTSISCSQGLCMSAGRAGQLNVGRRCWDSQSRKVWEVSTLLSRGTTFLSEQQTPLSVTHRNRLILPLGQVKCFQPFSAIRFLVFTPPVNSPFHSSIYVCWTIQVTLSVFSPRRFLSFVVQIHTPDVSVSWLPSSMCKKKEVPTQGKCVQGVQQ